MNNITIEELSTGQTIWFYKHPADKIPLLQTQVQATDEDDRGRGYVKLKGIDEWQPVYMVKPISQFAAEKLSAPVMASSLFVHPVKGLDY